MPKIPQAIGLQDYFPIGLSNRNLLRREERGIEIARQRPVAITRSRRGRWLVPAQSGDEHYLVEESRKGTPWYCSCPDEKICKHVYAVQFLVMHAGNLMERLLLGESWHDARIMFGSNVPYMIAELERRYLAMLQSARGYRPPPDDLLTAFSLEAIGDDAIVARRLGSTAAIMLRGAMATKHRPWVARITGLCPRYEFAREFQDGQKDYREANRDGSRGVWLHYNLPPGLYEIQELEEKSRREIVPRRYFARVADLALTRIDRREVVAEITGKGID